MNEVKIFKGITAMGSYYTIHVNGRFFAHVFFGDPLLEKMGGKDWEKRVTTCDWR